MRNDEWVKGKRTASKIFWTVVFIWVLIISLIVLGIGSYASL